MEKKTDLGILIVATVLIKAFALLPLASAELNVTCEDYSFIEQKLDDCNYFLESDLTDEEKLELLNALDQQSYVYEEVLLTPIHSLELRIETNYVRYGPGETIEVNIFPKDTLIAVTYGATTKFVKDQTSFTAIEGITQITAAYNRENFVRDIDIRQNPLLLAWKITLFAFLNYFLASLSKSSLLVKWLNVVS